MKPTAGRASGCGRADHAPIRGSQLAAPAVALLVLLVAACAPGPGCSWGRRAAVTEVDAPCSDRLPSLIEVRDGQGVLLLAARAVTGAEGDATLCDPMGRALGRLIRQRGGLAIRDPGGGIGSRLDVPDADAGPGPGEEPVLHFAKHSARLHEDGALLRILDENGVPLGQIERQPGRAIAFDAAGRGLATSERVEQQHETRLALRAPDGSTLRLILGVHSERAAAVFGLPGLPLPEATLVARLLDDR